MSDSYELRCKECGKLWGNSPRSFCEECFSPLEVSFDYAAIKKRVRREDLPSRISTCGAIPNSCPSRRFPSAHASAARRSCSRINCRRARRREL